MKKFEYYFNTKPGKGATTTNLERLCLDYETAFFENDRIYRNTSVKEKFDLNLARMRIVVRDPKFEIVRIMSDIQNPKLFANDDSNILIDENGIIKKSEILTLIVCLFSLSDQRFLYEGPEEAISSRFVLANSIDNFEQNEEQNTWFTVQNHLMFLLTATFLDAARNLAYRKCPAVSPGIRPSDRDYAIAKLLKELSILVAPASDSEFDRNKWYSQNILGYPTTFTFAESFLYGKYDLEYNDESKAIVFQSANSEIMENGKVRTMYGDKVAERKKGGEEYSTYGIKFEKDKPRHPIFKKVFV